MTESGTPTVYRCSLCETLFESGVSDTDRIDFPRCPQCGFCEAEPVMAQPDELVIRRTTKFR